MHFQCILKSTLHEDYKRIVYKSLYSTTCLYLAVMYVTMQPYRECQRMQTFLPRSSVKRQVRSQQSNCAPARPGKLQSTTAVSILLLPHTSCISLSTILWNVNFITCAWSLSYPPWYVSVCILEKGKESVVLCRPTCCIVCFFILFQVIFFPSFQ